MAKSTVFVVQAFEIGAKGALHMRPPVQVKDAVQAKTMALKLEPKVFGVMAIARRQDPDLGEYDDPEIIAQLGNVPEEAIALITA